MSADVLSARLNAYRRAEDRASWLRDAIAHLETADTVRVALSREDFEDVRTVLIPASVALPYFRDELQRAESIIASFNAAAAPLLALGA